jgi:hypothetical protein
MGQQTSVEDVVPLVPSDIVEEEQVEVGEDVGKTSKRNYDKIEMDLKIIILMVRKCSSWYSIIGARECK